MGKNFEDAKQLLVEKAQELIAETNDRTSAALLCNHLFANYNKQMATYVVGELQKLGATEEAIEQMLIAAQCVYDIVKLRHETGVDETPTQKSSMLAAEGLKQNIWPKNAYKN